MIIPVRCYTCNKVIANKWENYVIDINNGISFKDALDKIGLHRYCCRRMFLSHTDILDKILVYSIAKSESKEL
jgi:DNA-directed RNA polymerase I, II, and III subunit RPABC5